MFYSSEATNLSRPHNDALVLTLNISNCEVSKILVDKRSLAGILFLSTLREIEIDEFEIEKSTTVLIGFDRKSTAPVGKIKLPVFTIRENKITTFLVMDYLSVYNIILGRLWIHAMKAIPSTYHQRIRFPTRSGLREIKGNWEIAQTCYLNSMKLKADNRL